MSILSWFILLLIKVYIPLPAIFRFRLSNLSPNPFSLRALMIFATSFFILSSVNGLFFKSIGTYLPLFSASALVSFSPSVLKSVAKAIVKSEFSIFSIVLSLYLVLLDLLNVVPLYLLISICLFSFSLIFWFIVSISLSNKLLSFFNLVNVEPWSATESIIWS